MTDRRNEGDRSGLDYLYKTNKLGSAKGSETSSSATSGVDASIRAYASMRVLDSIRRFTQDKKSVRLSEVGKDVDMGADALVPLAQRLAEVKLIEVVDPVWGDDAVALTEQGRVVVDEGRDRELTRLLGSD